MFGGLILLSIIFGYGDTRYSPIGILDVGITHARIALFVGFLSGIFQVVILILLFIYYGFLYALLGFVLIGICIGISCGAWKLLFGYSLNRETDDIQERIKNGRN